MTLAQLRVFEAVVAHGGFAAAARALGMSQPAVSAQLAALERTHDVRLIDRASGPPAPGGAVLTAAGAALHGITEPLFALAARAEELLADAADLGGEPIRIAADAPGYLMPLLAAVRRRHPDARFAIAAGNATEAIEAVRTGRADVGVAAEVPDERGLHRVELRTQNLVAVVRTDHPRAGGKTLRLAELAGEPIIGRERGSGTRRALERAAADAGIALTYGMTADSREAVLAAAAAGLGVGIVAEDEMLEDPRLVMLDLRGPAIPVVEHLVCRAGARDTPVWRALLAALPAGAAPADPAPRSR
ncbi:LysR substrate-binding domain-containing protein [Microbacterium sp. ASV81]|uniref:LysR substrate-binding domain-containing protein n=1 Tax=Microbacterium capsulatum TaxID=3041921 RepID=A0ABU0XJJ7_9MICO|nr:LysR substrate-binding domain-containing protein [Microbacterium sp. ASV81]MDQ4215321.1 LysR substrate-binding domain-containing protein [Microbacterium sp. ASV81]